MAVADLKEVRVDRSNTGIRFANDASADPNTPYFITLAAFLMALSSGTLYAWACINGEIKDTFGFSQQATTDVFSLGFVGEFVPAFTFGIVLKHYGPQVGTILSTGLVSVTYFGIFIQTLYVWKIWVVFAILHAVMGYGSIGFYFCSLYLAGSVWPPEKAGKTLGFMAATYAGSGALTAQIYKMCGSLRAYYCTLAILCLIVGVIASVLQKLYPLAAAPQSRHPTPRILTTGSVTSTGTSSTDAPQRYGSTGQTLLQPHTSSLPSPHLPEKPHTQSNPVGNQNSEDVSDDDWDMEDVVLTKDKKRGHSAPAIRAWNSTGAMADLAREEFLRRPTMASDQSLHNQQTALYEMMYGPVMPETQTPPEVVNWTRILSAPEFWTLLATFLCLNGTSLMIVAQLASLKDMMGVHGVHTETLVIIYQVSDCCARLGLAVLSDATSQTTYFRRNFYVIVANGFMFLALNLLLWGSGDPGRILLFSVCVTGGFGNGSSSMIGPVIVRQAFGTQWIGIVLGLMKAGQALSNVVFGKFFVYTTADTTHPTTSYITSVKVSMFLVTCSLSGAVYIWWKSILLSQKEGKKGAAK